MEKLKLLVIIFIINLFTVELMSQQPVNVSAQILSANADVEEYVNSGIMEMTSSDLELFNEGTVAQQIGLHFTGMNIPIGATIENAYIQFSTDETSTSAVTLRIQAEISNNPQIWSTANSDLSSRTRSSTSVLWSPTGWSMLNERDTAQQTPNLSSIIQEVVLGVGYVSNDAINLIISGVSGDKRVARTYDGGPAYAPELFVTYSIDNTENNLWQSNGSDISYLSGNVGVGTIDPGTWKLAVNGKIRAKEIKVETAWADYVFEEGYRLPSLAEVRRHISEKGHLINMPSAAEVELNGIELGEMNKLLLEKIEELTLYLLKMETEIIDLKEKLE